MPRARTAASADSAILDVPQASSVKYLFIPAALSDDVEERILTVPEGKEVECLTDTLKGHFSAVGGDGGGASSVMIEAIKAQLAAKHGADAAAQVDPALLAQFAGQQMVEITSIQPGTKANGFCSTNMYSDDQGVAKQLPVNQRASAMCQACGKELQVTGDVFLSRVYDDGDEFRRLDFTSDEMSSSAPWVKLAQEHHRANPPAPAGAPTMMNSGDPDELRRLAGSMGSGSPGFVAPAPSPQPSPLEKKKAEGNRWFKKKKFKLAIGAYTEAIAMAEQELQTKAVLHGNRAACHACMEDWETSAADALACTESDPAYLKGWFRLAKARLSLGQLPGAAEAAKRGLDEAAAAGTDVSAGAGAELAALAAEIGSRTAA